MRLVKAEGWPSSRCNAGSSLLRRGGLSVDSRELIVPIYRRRYRMAGQQTRAQQLVGGIAPKLAELTDEVLFGDVWARPELSRRDRSLITVAALTALGRTDQLRSHLGLALDNGVTREELAELATHLAFYAGWPAGMSGATTLKQVIDER
jgi:4-carboxymuconolactone decarboxylase